MTLDERCNLVLAFARTLFVNGQATDHTMAAAEQLARSLGLRATLTARWGELLLHADGKDGALNCQISADPTGVHMGRVASTMRAIADIGSGRLALDAAMAAIGATSRTPPAPTWLFAFAAATAAAALSVIYGITHFVTMALIFASAGAGAVIRRALARLSQNDLFSHSAQHFSPVSSAGWRSVTI